MDKTKKPRVCILTSVHSPFDVRIFHKQAKSLVKAGYEITLIAQHDKSETVEGVKILGFNKPQNRMKRMIMSPWLMIRKAIQVKADIYHFHDPELIPLGILLRLLGHYIIYDVHEDVPRQILSKNYIPVLIRRPVALMMLIVEWISAKIFSLIITATPKIAEHFPRHKTHLVQNFPLANELIGSNSNTYKARPPSFAYIGGISKNRGAIEMVRALELIQDCSNASIQLAGTLSNELLNELKSMKGWPSVKYFGHISRLDVARLLGDVRCGLVLFHPLPNHVDAQPNKLFEYMSAGLPVIASDFPLWRRIIEKTGCGLVVDPNDPVAIADAMRWMIEHPDEACAMGRNGQKAVEEIYNWENESLKLLYLYNKILNK